MDDAKENMKKNFFLLNKTFRHTRSEFKSARSDVLFFKLKFQLRKKRNINTNQFTNDQ